MIPVLFRTRVALLWICIAPALAASAKPLSFFSAGPAPYSTETSNEALPVGNGKLAALVYGDPARDIIQFNEDTVWAGTPHDYSHPGAADWLDQVRQYIWNDEGEKAWDLALREHGMSIPLRQSPYQPTANLILNFDHKNVSNYRRSLDLETATATVQYQTGGITYKRETFASFPDQILVVRLTASQPEALSFSYAFETQHATSATRAEDDQLILDARVNVDIDKRRMQTSDVRFQARTRMLREGGSTSLHGSSISVANADSATLILSVASNYQSHQSLSANPEARVLATLDAISGKTYQAIREDHLADYTKLFDRVSLHLEGPAKTDLPIGLRLDAIDAKANTMQARTQALEQDINLVELNFQMGRYLLIAGSRPGSQPLTLQGKWNNELNPAWESKMTLNINQEMNYWLAEVGNLSETARPMVELARSLAQSGAQVAKVHYAADGWMVHHNTDLWRGAAPINSPGGIWPSGAAWLSMHLWWHYQYSQDPEILRDIYPLMKGAALFFDDFLVRDPREGRQPYLLTNPSHSPEQPNPALGDNGELVAGTTMDNQLIRGLYCYVIEASQILDTDAELRAAWKVKREQLPPNQIGKRGHLQEWLEDVDLPNQHRHLSPLLGLFPGDEITPQLTPELAEAIKVNLSWKGDGTNNTSWSQAWKMCLRAALGEGDHAFGILANLFAKSHTENFVFSRKGHENQIDGNMGSAMGIAQMLLQSDQGEIELLPALPSSLPTGHVTGLKARGGYTVDMAWAKGALTHATIHSLADGPCRIRSTTPITLSSESDEIALRSIAKELYEFTAKSGQTYFAAATLD